MREPSEAGREAREDPGGRSGSSSMLNELVEEVLERFATEGEGALEKARASHPELATQLQRRFDQLQRLGLLELLESPPGETIPERLGDYHLLRRLGGGGMGVVYLAEQESLGRRVALKLLRAQSALYPRARQRFGREVETVARLRHPGIVPVHAVGEVEGIPWFAMELVPGCSLADALERLRDHPRERLSGRALARAIAAHLREVGGDPAPESAAEFFSGNWVETCLRIARRIAETLDYAHGEGVVHRDVKPSNAMVTLDGRVLLVDFGLAVRADVSRMTRPGSLVGSLPYMAPEQFAEDGEQPTSLSDIYSLGVTLYELLTFQSPFESGSGEGLRSRILRGEARLPSEINRAVGRDAETVCCKAMEVDPARRYATAGDLARDLDNVLALRPIEARRAGAFLRLRHWLQRHPAAGVASVLGLLLALAGPLSYALVQRAANRRVEAKNQELTSALKATEAAHRQAAAHFADYLRLADIKTLEELKTEAAGLWPAHPDKVAAMKRWLERARALAGNLALHRAALERLQRKELPPELFAHGGAEYWRETLEGLVRDLTRFTDPEEGLLAGMERRLARASSIGQRSIGDHREAWREAIEKIARDKAYGGLALVPQLGLVPLGAEPRSGLWEFWHIESGEQPLRDPSSGALKIAAESGIVLVLLPGGSFWMGSQSANEEGRHCDPLATKDEGPVHEVKLAPFFLSKYELTQGQWKRTMGTEPSYYGRTSRYAGAEAPRHPVEQVSWLACNQALLQLGLLLPTEAQWEYACRAGTDSIWSTGDEVSSLVGYCNISDEGSAAHFVPGWSFEHGFRDGFVGHAPVGSFLPNAFGLHDMHGNVWEFCRDTFINYSQEARKGDGLRQGKPENRSYKVIRGGSFSKTALFARSADRDYYPEDSRDFFLGVRAARALVRD